ncbi:MAG: transcription antitermination factor NusB [Puniceicoccales bacterium]|jgi:N utilization substance protein B|nr:transcription antitermination factor NusB [Puniceicoccales bacterium]
MEPTLRVDVQDKTRKTRRRQQRQCIVECLYMWDMQQDVAMETLFKNYCEERCTEMDASILNSDFVINMLQGVVCSKIAIDAYIQNCAKNWTFSRIAKMDLAILRLALFELLFCKKVPAPVIINEAIELSKTYSSEDSRRFINGILDQLAKEREVH